MVTMAVQGSCSNNLQVLLSPPGVFGRIETGQVFVLFDNVHLFTGPGGGGAQ